MPDVHYDIDEFPLRYSIEDTKEDSSPLIGTIVKALKMVHVGGKVVEWETAGGVASNDLKQRENINRSGFRYDWINIPSSVFCF
jgi:hypothetical protein